MALAVALIWSRPATVNPVIRSPSQPFGGGLHAAVVAAPAAPWL
jgi:hypothetical protein